MLSSKGKAEMDAQQWEQDAQDKQQKVAELEQEVQKAQQELQQVISTSQVRPVVPTMHLVWLQITILFHLLSAHGYWA